MKTIFSILFFIITSISLNAQVPQEVNKINQEEEIFTVVDEKASPYEGSADFSKRFLSKFDTSNVSTPTGQLLVRLVFVVEKDGSLTNVDVINDTHNLLDHAKRTLLRMPKWKPAKQNGVVVRSRYNFPMNIPVRKR